MTDPFHLDRRALMQRVLALAGAGAACSLAFPALAEEALKAGPVLSSDRFMTLTAIADTIVPRTATAGAVDAKVPASFDALLANWASPDRREALTSAIDEIDAIARKAHGKPFAGLPSAERNALLSAHEAEALVVLPPDPEKKGKTMAAMLGGPDYANAGYGKMKDLIVLLYYLSEPALTEELSYVHNPGEWKPSIPVTPATRPSAGTPF